ncbi:MAG TPA: hypothetical protein ENN69_05255 [Spirochaetia bacterium]|nr:hypothetical protein [Spirochaetia bacterium]
MKTITLTLMLLFTASLLWAGNGDTIDPLAFVPPDVQRAENSEWINRYQAELILLLQGSRLSPHALKTGAAMCRTVEFAENPEQAALMVWELLKETDYLLRRGMPPHEITVRIKAAWRARLHDEKHKINIKKEEYSSLSQLDFVSSILAEKELTLPAPAQAAMEKIDDKIKDKKIKIK